MYRELNDGIAPEAGAEANSPRRIAKRPRRRRCGALSGGDPGDTEERDSTKVVPVPVTARTVAFGTVEADLEVPYDEGGIAWDPSLVFPGLRRREHLESRIELAPRAPILAGNGEPLAEGPAEAREHPLGSAMIDVTGEIGMAEEDELRGARPPRVPAGDAGRYQRRRAGLQHPPRRQARRHPARGRRQRRLGAGHRQGGAEARRPGARRRSTPTSRRQRSPRSPAAPAASRSSTPTTATSAPSPARRSPLPSRRARPSRC